MKPTVAHWISVDEQLPEPGTKALVVASRYGQVGLAIKTEHGWGTHPGKWAVYPTHWAPLPEGPK